MSTWDIGGIRYRYYRGAQDEHVVYYKTERVGIYANRQQALKAAQQHARSQQCDA